MFDKDVLEIRYKGRIFHVVAGKMFDTFRQDPDGFFRRLQAHSALFDESGVMAKPMATGRLWFDLYVLMGRIFVAVCGYVEGTKALRPISWFFAGLLGTAD